MSLTNLLFGVFFSAIISAAAYLRGSLSASGVFGGVLLGTVVYTGGGLPWAILLVAFFVSSSLLSHYKARIKEPLAEKFQKGHRRDLGQVLANGGAAGIAALAYAFTPQQIYLIAFVGALATVTADTWATELGVLSVRPPRMITTGRIAAAGTSGAITLLGTSVALAGALFIGITAAVTNGQAFSLTTLLICGGAGLLGSLFDSLLGATVQATYFCDVDQTETESSLHRCGRATRLVRGWRWLDNDWVNFISSVVGAGLAVLTYSAIR